MGYTFYIYNTTNHKLVNDYNTYDEAEDDLMYFKVFSALNKKKGLHFVIIREDELDESILKYYKR